MSVPEVVESARRARKSIVKNAGKPKVGQVRPILCESCKMELFARLRAYELMPSVRGFHIRIQRAKLCRFVLRMVGFVVIRDAAKFARMGTNLACLVSYFHAFPALRALSVKLPSISYDS